MEAFPPKSKFSVDDIPDLAGKVIIVTGANTGMPMKILHRKNLCSWTDFVTWLYPGIGKETAKALLLHHAKVYIAARSQEKAEAAIKDLKQETGKEALFLKLDLSDLKSVKAAAEEFMRCVRLVYFVLETYIK